MPYNNQNVGYQKNKQSHEAAMFNVEGKLTIRDRVKIAFETFGDMTVEEVCKVLQREKCSVQPRITELRMQVCLRFRRCEMGKYGTTSQSGG